MSPLAAPFLLAPDRSLEELTRREAGLKTAYIQATIHPDSLPSPAELLQRSVDFLQLALALAGFVEAAHLLGVESAEDAAARLEEVRVKAQRITGLDPVATVGADERPDTSTLPPMEEPFGTAALQAVVRAAASTVDACPIATLERVALSLDDDRLGARCRNAYEGLKAFVRRNDPRLDGVARTVGHAYAEGRLSADEAARVLAITVPDLIPFLEDKGYVRPLEVIELQDAERARLLERVRGDRLARGGQPQHAPEAVRREVIASQRVEGIDARPWL